MQTLLNQVKEIFDNEQFIFPPEHLYQPIDYTLRLGGTCHAQNRRKNNVFHSQRHSFSNPPNPFTFSKRKKSG